MKNIKIAAFISILLNIGFGTYSAYRFVGLYNTKVVAEKQHDKQRFNIAVFTPTTHPSLEDIERGFVETLQNYDQISSMISIADFTIFFVPNTFTNS